jgi:hypothetical protein
VTKYLYIKVLQANYGFGHGWENIEEADTRRALLPNLKAYRENMPEYPYRIIGRRVLRQGVAS